MKSKISTKEILSTVLCLIIFFTVFLNTLIHATNTPMLFLNDDKNPVLTIWTSISFLLLLISFNKLDHLRKIGSSLLLLFQIPSIILLIQQTSLSSHAYFSPSSSITVSFFITLALHNLLRESQRFMLKCLSFYSYFIATFIPITGLWSLLFQSQNILTLNESNFAVGFSMPTIFLSSTVLMVTSITHLNKDHNYLQIKAFFYSFKFFYFQLFSTSVVAIVLIKSYSWSPFLAISITFFIINLIMILFTRKWIERKASEEKVTICSWNNTIRSNKTGSDKWLCLAEFLDERGFIVSHGISPEALKHRKANREKYKQQQQ